MHDDTFLVRQRLLWRCLISGSASTCPQNIGPDRVDLIQRPASHQPWRTQISESPEAYRLPAILRSLALLTIYPVNSRHDTHGVFQLDELGLLQHIFCELYGIWAILALLSGSIHLRQPRQIDVLALSCSYQSLRRPISRRCSRP